MSVEDSQTGPGVCGDNAAPYVLGALTAEEQVAFRRHLESCAICREEVTALQLTVSALPALAPQLGAPPALKRRVMASVEEDLSSAQASRSARPSRSLVDRLRWQPLVASAALAAVAAVLAVIVLSPGGGGTGTRLIRAEVTPRGASASLRVSGGHAQLEVSGMPQTAPQRVYEVWIKRSGAPQPTDALFTVTTGGEATVGVPGSLAGVKLIMVTSEPRGGSSVPTSPPVIVAHLS